MLPSYAGFFAEFRDLDAYVASLQGADIRYTMTRPNGSVWNVGRVLLPGGIVIQSSAGGCGCILESGTPDVFVNLFLHRQGHFIALGKELDLASIVFMPPGSESITQTYGQYGCYSILIPRQLFQVTDALRELGSDESGRARTIRSNSATGDSARPLLARLFSNIAVNPEILLSPVSLAEFRDELVDVLAREYGQQPEARPARGERIPKVDVTVISRAVDAIEASSGPRMTMTGLTDMTGVPERSLRDGFNRYLGVSPRQYMQLRALHKAHSRLASGSPEETTVARVATDLGIWDLGRFAARYRRVFGELPSATLRRY